MLNKIGAVFLSAVLVLASLSMPVDLGNRLIIGSIAVNAASRSTNESANAAYDERLENPYNKQDDMEVAYDGSRWRQPKEWNTPTINPKDYKGGIMLYFDKIGLEPEYAQGKVQRIYFSITGATEPVGYIKFHVFYDTRLKVKENSNGEVITPGNALKGFTTGSSMIEEGQLVFYAYSENTMLSDSSLFTIDFVVPENAEQGEVYPIGISYIDDNIAYDTFINSEQDEAGRLQMTYVFTKGIYSGYIKINGDKKTTATTTTTTTTTSLTTESTTTSITTTGGGYPELKPEMIGDLDKDGKAIAADAALLLKLYAELSSGSRDATTEEIYICDVNRNGKIEAGDAALILKYYAEASGGYDETIDVYLKEVLNIAI